MAVVQGTSPGGTPGSSESIDQVTGASGQIRQAVVIGHPDQSKWGQYAEPDASGNLPVTSIDGGIATIGTTSDASSASTLVGLLKAVKASLAGTLTATLVAGTALIGKVAGSDGNPLLTGPAATGNAPAGLLATAPQGWNGATFDALVCNEAVTLLPSAARTATIGTGQQTNVNARGVVLILNVSAASGTGGLTVQLRYYDPVSGNQVIAASGPNITVIGTYALEVYPGVQTSGVGPNVTAVSAVLPRQWQAVVGAGDSSSYTYSLAAMPVL